MFFIVIQAQLVDLCLEELALLKKNKSFSKLEIIESTHQGITLRCPINMGLSLNYFLKSATRILLRVHEFKARDYPKLYKKLLQINWREFSMPWASVKVSTHESRLIHSGRIEKTFHDALAKYFEGQPLKKKREIDLKNKKAGSTIYLRAENDHFTVSLDTSGERLDYKTDESKFIGLAPVRSTYAYAHLKDFLRHFKSSRLSLLDPMAGSGTYLQVALDWTKANDKRTYAFEAIYPIDKSDFQLERNSPFVKIQGNDLDKKNAQQLEKNFKNIQITNLDYKKIQIDEEKTVIVTNPPYGIKVKTPIPIKEFIGEMLSHFSKHSQVAGISFIHPIDSIEFSLNDFIYKKGISFSNGGIKVYCHHFYRQQT